MLNSSSDVLIDRDSLPNKVDPIRLLTIVSNSNEDTTISLSDKLSKGTIFNIKLNYSDASGLFSGYAKDDIGLINNTLDIDFNSVLNASNLLSYIDDLTDINLVLNNATNIDRLFKDDESLVNVKLVAPEALSAVSTFSNCINLSNLDNIDIHKVVDFTNTFSNTNISDISNLFNYAGIDLANADILYNTFSRCNKLKEINITTSASNCKCTFSNCENIEYVYANLLEAESIDGFLNLCTNLKYAYILAPKAKSASRLFEGCSSLVGCYVYAPMLEDSSNMFSGCINLVNNSKWVSDEFGTHLEYEENKLNISEYDRYDFSTEIKYDIEINNNIPSLISKDIYLGVQKLIVIDGIQYSYEILENGNLKINDSYIGVNNLIELDNGDKYRYIICGLNIYMMRIYIGSSSVLNIDIDQFNYIIENEKLILINPDNSFISNNLLGTITVEGIEYNFRVTGNNIILIEINDESITYIGSNGIIDIAGTNFRYNLTSENSLELNYRYESEGSQIILSKLGRYYKKDLDIYRITEDVIDPGETYYRIKNNLGEYIKYEDKYLYLNSEKRLIYNKIDVISGRLLNTNFMFSGCLKLEVAPLLDMSLDKYAIAMFYGCSELYSLPSIYEKLKINNESEDINPWGLHNNAENIITLSGIYNRAFEFNSGYLIKENLVPSILAKYYLDEVKSYDDVMNAPSSSDQSTGGKSGGGACGSPKGRDSKNVTLDLPNVTSLEGPLVEGDKVTSLVINAPKALSATNIAISCKNLSSVVINAPMASAGILFVDCKNLSSVKLDMAVSKSSAPKWFENCGKMKTKSVSAPDGIYEDDGELE